jgi:hypothetical protein
MDKMPTFEREKEGWEEGSPLEIQSLRRRLKFKLMLSDRHLSFEKIRQALQFFAVEDESGELQVIDYQEGTGAIDNVPIGMEPLSEILEILGELEESGSLNGIAYMKNHAVAEALYELRDQNLKK